MIAIIALFLFGAQTEQLCQSQISDGTDDQSCFTVEPPVAPPGVPGGVPVCNAWGICH